MKSESFESERLLFREIRASDAEVIVRWRSNPEIYRYYISPNPVTLRSHLEWYEGLYLNDLTRIDYIVTEKESMTPIGVTGISRLIDKSCEIGYTIGEASFQGKGYGTESILAVRNEYIKKGIEVFYAIIHVNNIASIKAAEKSGFQYFSNIEMDFLQYRYQTEGVVT